jgi:hypothetical protein
MPANAGGSGVTIGRLLPTLVLLGGENLKQNQDRPGTSTRTEQRKKEN